jgi:hypothetical protein
MGSKALSALKDKKLVEFATGSSGKRMSVILEARRPKLVVSVVRTAEGSKAHLSPATPAGSKTLEVHMADLARALAELGFAKRARINRFVGCFVLEVTPQELITVAGIPSIQAIRVNRTHRRLAAQQHTPTQAQIA